jgi:hypothetical protein
LALSRFRNGVVAAIVMWLVLGLKADPTNIISKQFLFHTLLSLHKQQKEPIASSAK